MDSIRFTVPFNEYSYEALSGLVKMLYVGEVAIRVEMLSQFYKILHHLEIACPCCIPIEFHNTPGEESYGEGWEQASDDPNDACKFLFYQILQIHQKIKTSNLE